MTLMKWIWIGKKKRFYDVIISKFAISDLQLGFIRKSIFVKQQCISYFKMAFFFRQNFLILFFISYLTGNCNFYEKIFYCRFVNI